MYGLTFQSFVTTPSPSQAQEQDGRYLGKCALFLLLQCPKCVGEMPGI